MYKFILAALVLLFTTLSQPAQAKLTLVFDDPTTEGIDITVEDNSSWDENVLEGKIRYCNQSGGFLSCAEGVSKPTLSSAEKPVLILQLGSFNYSGSMNVMLSETDFTVGASTVVTQSTGDFDSGDTVTINWYGDSGNQLFGQGFLIDTLGPVSAPAFEELRFFNESPSDALGSLTISINMTGVVNQELDGNFLVEMSVIPLEGNWPVPDVVGEEQSFAETLIVASNLTVGQVATQASSTVQEGFVISQSPAAGVTLLPGSPVNLLVSAGSAPVEVENPAGLAGTWYDPLFEGEGYSAQVTSDGMFLFYYGHDATGRRLWLVSDIFSGSYQFGQSIELVLFRGTGTFADPNELLQEWGTLTIIFDSCSTGRAYMDGIDGTKRHDLTKLTGIGDLDCDS